MIETLTFVCSICGETSTDICVYCTKDTCANHRCLRCFRCSDCCECEVPLTAGEVERDHEEPEAAAEPSLPVEPPPPSYIEPQPELPGVAAIVVPEPEPEPSPVEQATTQEELVRALPELFAAEPEPPPPPPADAGKDEHSDAGKNQSSEPERQPEP